jgi:hypothetical protein
VKPEDVLPSSLQPASVDKWVVARLMTKGAQRRASLERDLPKDLAGDSAFKAIDAALLRLRNAGRVTLANHRFALVPEVKS